MIKQQESEQEAEKLETWAKLRFLAVTSQNVNVELTKNFATFGRASLDDGVEGFKFTQFENYSTATVSRTHFVITRESAASDANTNPPVVTCFSRNGMNVNSDELYKGQKRILLDGDIIKINATAVFVFHDLRLKRQQEHEYFPTRIRNKYFIGEFLGKGGYGTVQMIHNVKTFEKFAIKVVQLKLDKDGKPNAYKKRQIENEIDLMMSLNHPNLMSLIDRSERSRNMFLIMDLMDMDLLKYLLTLNGHLMFETPARLFFYQICKGVEHLHSKNIVHRDLKVDNILIKIHENSKQIQLRIGDFGFSKYDPEGMFYTQLGTECYTAPEILELLDDENSNAYTTQADVWSLGCILFMMLTGRFAFHSSYGGNVRDQIKAADFDRNLLEGNSFNARELVEKMFQLDPSKRPTVNEIIKFPWFDFPRFKSQLKSFVDELNLPADYNMFSNIE